MSKIIFMMGVSGSGKTTIFNSLEIFPQLSYVQSYTTRPLRPGEINGVKYNHISRDAFEQAIMNNEFVEYATVHATDLYGTKWSSIQTLLDQGKFPTKEIEIYGLEKIAKNPDMIGKYTSIFLNIDDTTIRERIISRNPATSEEEIQRRIHSAQYERSMAGTLCDHIVNAGQPLEDVIRDVHAIIKTIVA